MRKTVQTNTYGGKTLHFTFLSYSEFKNLFLILSLALVIG